MARLTSKINVLAFTLAALLSAGCSEDSGEVEVTTGKEVKLVDKDGNPISKTANRPCSKYNLGFYRGDLRKLQRNTLIIGERESDAVIEMEDGPAITILGFEGQAEKYFNYYVYYGIKNRSNTNKKGLTVNETTKTQITVCFKQNIIAVMEYKLVETGRGKLVQQREFINQWAYDVRPEDD